MTLSVGVLISVSCCALAERSRGLVCREEQGSGLERGAGVWSAERSSGLVCREEQGSGLERGAGVWSAAFTNL